MFDGFYGLCPRLFPGLILCRHTTKLTPQQGNVTVVAVGVEQRRQISYIIHRRCSNSIHA